MRQLVLMKLDSKLRGSFVGRLFISIDTFACVLSASDNSSLESVELSVLWLSSRNFPHTLSEDFVW